MSPMGSLLDNYLTTDSPRSDVIAFLAALDHLYEKAPTIAEKIVQELRDQRSYIKLIASENYSSLTTQLAMGNLLTDKYSEGYPFHRFYAGCENVDSIEAEAAQAAMDLFGAHHAYVQPHSGADANLVAFWAILTKRIQEPYLEKKGKQTLDELTDAEHEELRQLMCRQKLMGLSLSSGGHLTHGYRHNVSGRMFQPVFYDVDPKTGLLNYDTIAEIARKEKPLVLIAGYSAYSRAIDFAKMREIADEVGAVLMVDMAHFAGLVAGKALTGTANPVPYAHILTSTTHKTLRGPRGGIVLCVEEFVEGVNKGCPHVLGGPLPHVMAAKAVAFQEALKPEFQDYAKRVVANAQALAKQLEKSGLRVLTGGTDNHMVMVDISSTGLTGRQAELGLREAGLTVNRNMIPFDQNGPWYTTGIRVGTPAVTTLGMGTAEMEEIGKIIAFVLQAAEPTLVPRTGRPSRAKCRIDEKVLAQAKERVATLLRQFPLYPELSV